MNWQDVAPWNEYAAQEREVERYASGFDPNEPRDAKGEWTTGGGAPRKAPSSRVSRVIEEADAIEVLESKVPDSIGEKDFVAIESALTDEESAVLDSFIDDARVTFINEQMEYFEPDVDERDVANANDFHLNDVYEKGMEIINDLVDDDDARPMKAKLKEWRLGVKGIQGMYGRRAAKAMASDFDPDRRDRWDVEAEHVDDEAFKPVFEAMDAYVDEASAAMNEAMDKDREDQEEEQRTKLKRDYDDGETDKIDWLREFRRDHAHEARFSGEVTKDAWSKTADGYGYAFETKGGNDFHIDIGLPRQTSHWTHWLTFNDSAGSFAVTDSGEAFDVFGNVTKAIVAIVKKKKIESLSFSAAEKSRQRLYDRLTKTLTATMPEYAAVAVKHGDNPKLYLVAKRSELETLKDTYRTSVERSGGNPDLSEMETLRAARDPGPEPDEVEFEDIDPEIREEWWTPEGWPVEPSEEEEKLRYAKRGQPENAGEFGPGGGGAKPAPTAQTKQVAQVARAQQKKAEEQVKAEQEAHLESTAKMMPPWNVEPSPEQKTQQAAQDYRQNATRAKAFKDWFGDWEADPENASKVVNRETGEPQKTHEVKKVFHGTLASFDAFSKQHAGQHGSVVGRGFYFAEDERIATAYLHGSRKDKPIEAYLSIKNPFDFDSRHGLEDMRSLATNAGAAMVGIGGIQDASAWEKELKNAFGRFMAVHGKELSGLDVHSAIAGVVGRERVNEVMAKLGYDGITHLSKDEAGTPKRPDSPKDFGRCWVAFDPHQIKSTDNVGTFNPKDERFRYAAGWNEQEHHRGQPENKGEFGPGGGGPAERPQKNVVNPQARQQQAEKQAQEFAQAHYDATLAQHASSMPPWSEVPQQSAIQPQPDIDSHVNSILESIIEAIKSIPVAIVKWAVNLCKSIYAKAEAKYGSRWAKAIVATAIITMPTPFTMGATAAMAGLAHVWTRYVGRGPEVKGTALPTSEEVQGEARQMSEALTAPTPAVH